MVRHLRNSALLTAVLRFGACVRMAEAPTTPVTRRDMLGYLLKAAVPVALAVLAWSTVRRRPPTLLCYQDYGDAGVQICRHQCIHGHFSLPWMSECRPWLQCSDIESDDFEVGRVLGSGAVKVVGSGCIQLLQTQPVQSAVRFPLYHTSGMSYRGYPK